MSNDNKRVNLNALKKILLSPNKQKKLKALEVISNASTANAIPLLCEWVFSETDPEVLSSALKTIGELGNIEHISTIEPFFKHDNQNISNAALKASSSIRSNSQLVDRVRELKGILGKNKQKIDQRWQAVKTEVHLEDLPEIQPKHQPEQIEKTAKTVTPTLRPHEISVTINQQKFVTTRKKLGEILVEENFITEQDFLDILKEQEDNPHTMIGQLLMRNNLVTEKDLMKCLAIQQQVPYVSLAGFVPDPQIIKECGAYIIRRFNFLPIKEEDDKLIIAVSDPTFRKALEEVELALNRKISIVIADREEITAAIKSSGITEEPQ